VETRDALRHCIERDAILICAEQVIVMTGVLFVNLRMLLYFSGSSIMLE
jgi:hypothetical protein